MLIFNQPLYTGSLGSFDSEVLKLDLKLGYCVQILFTGNPNGSLVLQGSDDSIQIPSNPVNWNEINGSTQSVTASGKVTYNVRHAYYNWVRVVYTDNSGGAAVGTCSIIGNCKGG